MSPRILTLGAAAAVIAVAAVVACSSSAEGEVQVLADEGGEAAPVDDAGRDGADDDAKAGCADGGARCHLVCVDLATNPRNCGYCDHSCDSCSAGVCPSVVFYDTTASPPGPTAQIVSPTDNVTFFADDRDGGALLRIDNGVATAWLTGLAAPSHLGANVAGGPVVLATSNGAGSAVVVAKDVGTSVTVGAYDGGAVSAIAMLTGNFTAVAAPAAVWRVDTLPVDGALFEPAPSLSALAVGSIGLENYVYFASTGGISRRRTLGSPSACAVAPGAQATFLAVSKSWVVWFDPAGAIRRTARPDVDSPLGKCPALSTTGPADVVAISDPAVMPIAMAAAPALGAALDDYVYWVGKRGVYRSPIDAGEIQTLATSSTDLLPTIGLTLDRVFFLAPDAIRSVDR